MKTYYFLTLTDSAPDLNPGSHLISDGIKALVQLADPHAILQDITLFSYNAKHWDTMLSRCDGIFLCGNPRFDPSDTSFFWVTDLLGFMDAARSRGVKVGDLYLGSACPLSSKEAYVQATELLFTLRNKATLERLLKFDLLITRDSISQCICSSDKGDSMLLHDSTFWAKDYYGIAPGPKLYNCVTLPALNCEPWLIESLYQTYIDLSEHKQSYLLCHSSSQYWLLKKQFPELKDIVLIYDSRSLLQFYSCVDKLVSCRLHGSIPALSLGANVCNVAVDSRSDAYDNFGFSSLPYTALTDGSLRYTFDSFPVHLHPSATPFVLQFKKKIMGE